jgi:hypothetical protein
VHIEKVHAPFMHRGAALSTVHRRPQAPQLAVLRCVSTQASSQHVWPVGQGRGAVHPAAQRLPTQSVPLGQWSSVTQATHWRLARLQRGCAVPASPVVAAQAMSSRQPV